MSNSKNLLSSKQARQAIRRSEEDELSILEHSNLFRGFNSKDLTVVSSYYTTKRLEKIQSQLNILVKRSNPNQNEVDLTGETHAKTLELNEKSTNKILKNNASTIMDAFKYVRKENHNSNIRHRNGKRLCLTGNSNDDSEYEEDLFIRCEKENLDDYNNLIKHKEKEENIPKSIMPKLEKIDLKINRKKSC